FLCDLNRHCLMVEVLLVERIPLLAEEGWRDSLIEAGAPGAKREPDRAKPQLVVSPAKRCAGLLLRLRPIGLALRATPSAPDQDCKPSPCFFFQSVTAALIASSARTEQWIFTGGRLSSLTISVFLIARASARVLPLTHSVARLELAIALPQPNVLNLASSMTPDSSLTLI